MTGAPTQQGPKIRDAKLTGGAFSVGCSKSGEGHRGPQRGARRGPRAPPRVLTSPCCAALQALGVEEPAHLELIDDAVELEEAGLAIGRRVITCRPSSARAQI
jgi:hypothetical protein